MEKLLSAAFFGVMVWCFQFGISNWVIERATSREVADMNSDLAGPAPDHVRKWQLFYVRNIFSVVAVGHGLTNALLTAILVFWL